MDQNFYKMMFFLSLKIVFILGNSADPDEMLPFHLGLPCLPKHLFTSAYIPIEKGSFNTQTISLLQDEVAHTLTENRVLQTTKHPFLTVSTIDRYSSADPEGGQGVRTLPQENHKLYWFL